MLSNSRPLPGMVKKKFRKWHCAFSSVRTANFMLKANFRGGGFQKSILRRLAVFLSAADAGTDALGWYSQKQDVTLQSGRNSLDLRLKQNHSKLILISVPNGAKAKREARFTPSTLRR